MTIALAASADGSSGSIQLNGVDVVVVTDNGIASIVYDNPTITNYTETLLAVSGSSLTVDLDNGTVQRITTTNNTSVTLPASVAGKSFIVIVQYGGAHSLTFTGGSTLKWNSNVTPTATSISGRIDIFTFFQDGTNTYGSVFGQGF